jgi:hypothetical protein
MPLHQWGYEMPGDLVPYLIGSLPEWAAVGIGGYGLRRRQERAEDFEAQLLKDTGKTADVLMRVMEEEDLFSEIVELGMQAASRSASESKRRLLARVVASALDGTGMATPDNHLLLVKTVDAIEPPHLQLLVKLATPHPGVGDLAGGPYEGRWTERDLLASWPELGEMLRPLLAVLEREGLVEEAGQGTYNTPPPNFAPSPYGRLLLRFLSRDELGTTNLGVAAIACRYNTNPSPVVVVRNLGPGIARKVHVSIPAQDRQILSESAAQDFDLGPLDEMSLEVEIPTLVNKAPYNVHLNWDDSRGEMRHVATVDSPK